MVGVGHRESGLWDDSMWWASAAHQPRCAGVTVAWNEWVGSNNMRPKLGKLAGDFLLLRSSSRSFNYSVCLVGCSTRISIG